MTDNTDRSALSAMALFATLATSARLWQAVRERRAGHDPSEQEDAAVVQPYLHRTARTLQQTFMRMQAAHAARQHQADTEDVAPSVAAHVQHFEQLMTLAQAARTLQVVHQRLLSLYPAVPEALVEEGRQVQLAAEALLEADDEALGAALGPFTERALAFTHALLGAVDAGSGA